MKGKKWLDPMAHSDQRVAEQKKRSSSQGQGWNFFVVHNQHMVAALAVKPSKKCSAVCIGSSDEYKIMV
jgi:hypothetical protein